MRIEKLVLIFAVVLVLYSSSALFRHGALWWDETVYLGLADNIFSKHEYSFNMNNEEEFRAPVFPALIAASYYLFDQVETAAKVVVLASSVLFVFAIYLLGRKIYCGTVGAMAALLAVSAPQFVFWSSKILSEIPSLLFAALSLYFSYIIVEEKKVRLYPALGALFALAFLTRYPLALLPALFFIWAFFRKRQSILFSKEAAYGTLVFLLMLVPWMYNSYLAYGSIFGALQYNTYIVNDLHSGSRGTYFSEFLPNYGILGELFLLGALYSLLNKERQGIFLSLWFALVFFGLSFLIAEKQVRYLLIALPALALVSSGALFAAYDEALSVWRKSGISVRPPKVIRWLLKKEHVAAAVAIAIALNSFSPEFGRAYNNKEIGSIVEDAGTYLRAHAPVGTRIMSQSTPPFYYYSKHEVIWFPKDEWAVMDFMGRYNVSYVEVDNYVWYPEFALNYFGNNKNFALEYNKTEGDKFIRIYRYLNG